MDDGKLTQEEIDAINAEPNDEPDEDEDETIEVDMAGHDLEPDLRG